MAKLLPRLDRIVFSAERSHFEWRTLTAEPAQAPVRSAPPPNPI